MSQKKFTVEEMVNCLIECAQEAKKENFFIDYMLNYQNEYISIIEPLDVLTGLLIEKLKIPESDLKNIKDFFDIIDNYIVKEHSNKELEDKLSQFQEEHYNLLEKNFYDQLDEVFKGEDKKTLEKLIDKRINIVRLCSHCISFHITHNHNDESIKLDEIKNGYIKNCDINLLKKSFDLKIYNIIPFIEDELFEQLPVDYIEKLVNDSIYDAFSSKSDRKIKHVLNNVSLITILQLHKEYLKDPLNLETYYKDIFSNVNIISEETFNIILDEVLYKGIEFCEAVTSNEEYVKKLIEEGYSNIIWALDENQFKGELLKVMKDSNILSQAIKLYDFPNDILRSDYVFNIFVEQFDNVFDYNFLLQRIPIDALTDERILTCVLNCQFNFFLNSAVHNEKIGKYQNRTVDDIKYAIEHGYKCSRKTNLNSLDEVKVFIENGQPEILNYVTNMYIPFDLVKSAVEHGYKLNKDTPVGYFDDSVLNCCLENKIYDAIIPYFYCNWYKLESSLEEHIEKNPTLSEDGTFKTFFENVGVLEQFIEVLITMPHKNLNFYGEDWLEYAKEIYKDNPVMLNYLESIYIPYHIENIEDIPKYFDEFGPTDELCDLGLMNGPLFKYLFVINSWEEKYNPDETIKKYIEFVDEYGLIPNQYISNKDDIYNYFDEFGPKEELFDLGLFDENIFTYLFNSIEADWKDFYKPNESVKAYIEFTKKYGLIFLKYIKNKDDIAKYFNSNGVSENFKILLNYNHNMTRTLLSKLSHNNTVLTSLSLEFVNVFEYYLIDEYFKDLPKEKRKEKYDYLLKNIGPKIVFGLESKKINKLINIDIEELDKLFIGLNLSKYDAIPPNIAYDNIVISLVNFEFRKKYPDIINTFTNINSILANISKEEFENYIYGGSTGQLSQKLSMLCFEVINCLELHENEINDFKEALIECKNSKEDRLRKYCKKYLKKKEKEYLNERRNKILADIGIPISFNREDAINKLSKNFQDSISYSLFDSSRKKMINNIEYEKLEQKKFIEQISMTKQEYDVILSITEDEFDSIISSIKNNTKPEEYVKRKFGLFKRFLKQFAAYRLDNENPYFELVQSNVKTENLIVLKDLDVMNVLSELDIDIFLNTIGNNKKLLEHFYRNFEWFFIGRLPREITAFFEKYNVKIPGGINNIGQFVNQYYNILRQKERLLNRQGKYINDLSEIRFFFTEIIDYISKTNSETIEIKRLLDSETYDDFVANPQKNAANYNRKNREFILVQLLDFLYTLDKVTIPSKDILISNKDNTNQINFIVGNRTNTSNICHGERTGACMRVGGIGEGLFLKCLTDKNWFHIRIEDPITHEYISRVSGFRNGNTVYLNQLRDSALPNKYSNKDLQEYIKIYAKTLIEDTKSSEYPIENVFINTSYAMENYKDEESNNQIYNLGYDIQSEYNLDDVLEYRLNKSTDIWTDVRTSAYLLATTENGAKTMEGYTPIKNGPENAESYDAVRDKIYGLKYEESDIPKHQFVQVDIVSLKEKINRVHGMKEKLLGKDYEYDIVDEIEDENEILDGYASSDWYVYLDNSYEIHFDYIKEINKDYNLIKYSNISKAKEEMKKYKDILVNKYSLGKVEGYAL